MNYNFSIYIYNIFALNQAWKKIKVVQTLISVAYPTSHGSQYIITKAWDTGKY